MLIDRNCNINLINNYDENVLDYCTNLNTINKLLDNNINVTLSNYNFVKNNIEDIPERKIILKSKT